MSNWGTKLYQSDVADMVRDDYKNKLRAGKSDEEALEEILMEYQNEMNDVEDKFDFWPALADTMWRYGRLTPEICDACLDIISATQEDIRWETEKDKEKRQKEMQTLKKKLLSDMPERRKVSVHKPYVCGWKEREVYSMQIEDDGKYNGCYIIVYVVEMVRGAYAVPGVYDTVPEVYLMLSKERIEQVEDIKNLELCCSVCNRKKNERRINYLICETSNRKRPKNIRYIGRLEEKYIPNVDYKIAEGINDYVMWWSLIDTTIQDYEFNLKLNAEMQEKRN